MYSYPYHITDELITMQNSTNYQQSFVGYVIISKLMNTKKTIDSLYPNVG